MLLIRRPFTVPPLQRMHIYAIQYTHNAYLPIMRNVYICIMRLLPREFHMLMCAQARTHPHTHTRTRFMITQ